MQQPEPRPDRTDAAVWQEPPRGSFPDPRIFQLSGLEQIRAHFRGKWARPPVEHLLGIECTGADERGARFEQPASPWLASIDGEIPSGALAVIADSAMGCAITAHRPPRTPFATAELSLDFMRPVPPNAGILVGEASQVHADGAMALSDATISDASGCLLAQATCRYVLLAQLPELTGDDGLPLSGAQIEADVPVLETVLYETPDPYQRPVRGEVLPNISLREMSGLDLLLGQIEGRLPPPPVHYLTGMRPTEVGDGTAAFALPASAWLTVGFGTVMGGFIALLAHSALMGAVLSTTPAGMSQLPLDIKINFLRPVFADPNGGELRATGRILHRGRSLSVASADVVGLDGRPVAMAMGTAREVPRREAASG
jgi:uncharacterized protein (TIGR00369 family)